jgi:hypothetical protein
MDWIGERQDAYIPDLTPLFLEAPMSTTRTIIVHAKRVPATDHAGSKMVAKSSDGKQITIGYPHQANDPHELAVRRLYPEALSVTEVATDTAQRGLKFVVEVRS